MDLSLIFSLSLCWSAAAARSTWSDKPEIIFSSDEIKDGETVKIFCLLPIDYTGGECRLYRRGSSSPFRRTTTKDYMCEFHLTSQELLGQRPVGRRVRFKCDYHLQQYTSVFSDSRGVTVWGSSPSPLLSVSRRFVSSPDDSVEVTCSPPLPSVYSCHFYRDEIHVAEGSCSRNLTGRQLAVWEKSTVLLPVNLTCKYYPKKRLEIRSEHSNHNMLLVVDPSQASSSVHCTVSMEDTELDSFKQRSWRSTGADGPTVTVHVTHSSMTTNTTCNPILT
ncbi:uncharacterized protein V6R79_011271 [Siganus canaliculatus]